MTDHTKLPNSTKELRILYDVGTTTWQKILRTIGIEKHKKWFTPLDKEKIIKHLGAP